MFHEFSLTLFRFYPKFQRAIDFICYHLCVGVDILMFYQYYNPQNVIIESKFIIKMFATMLPIYLFVAQQQNARTYRTRTLTVAHKMLNQQIYAQMICLLKIKKKNKNDKLCLHCMLRCGWVAHAYTYLSIENTVSFFIASKPKLKFQSTKRARYVGTYRRHTRIAKATTTPGLLSFRRKAACICVFIIVLI